MMGSHSSNWRQLADEQLFYFEQWIALLTGIGCLGVSVWSGLRDYENPLPALHLGWHEEVFVVLRWPLAIAVGLIGTALVRLAFAEGRKR